MILSKKNIEIDTYCKLSEFGGKVIKNVRLKIYEDIFSKCLRRIESSVLRDESYSLFLVPDFLVGKPTYNFQNCITYNIFRLKQSGFQVKYYYPNVLYITWSKKDFNTFLQIDQFRWQ